MAFQTIPPTVFAVAPAAWESSPSARWDGELTEVVLYLFKSFLSNTVSSLRRKNAYVWHNQGKTSHTSAEVISLDDKKPKDYKKPTMLAVILTVAALAVTVASLTLTQKDAVPTQGSVAQNGMSYYTPKASASQGSAAQPAGDEDGPYRVAVYDGKIGVFRQGEAEPFLTADVEVYLLPQEDIALLRQRIAPYVDDGEVRCLRFPGGSTNTVSRKYGGDTLMGQLKEQAEEQGWRWVDWNVSAEDAAGKKLSAEEVCRNVTGGSAGLERCIVLMHDSATTGTTAEALPSIIRWYKEEGYAFCTVSQLYDALE